MYVGRSGCFTMDIDGDFVVKVAPSTATSFFTYELVKEYLVPP